MAWAWSLTARTPWMMASGSASECASARSRLSTTGSHSEATAAWVSATAWLTWAAHRLRRLSRSASARSRRSSAPATRDRRSASSAPVPSLAAPAGAWSPAARAGASSPAGRARGAPGAPSSPAGSGCPVPGGRSSRAPPAAVSLMGGELRVDHIVAVGAGLRRTLVLRRRRRRTGCGHQALVHLLQFERKSPEPFDRSVRAESLPGVGRQGFRTGLLMHGQRVTALGEQVLHGVCGRVEFVAGIGQLAQQPVLFAMPVAISDHPLDLGLIQVGGLGDRDPLLGPGVLVPRGDVEYPVGVDVEGDLDLRYPARRRPDVLQPEPAENAVVSGPLPLALQDDDVHRGLVVFGCAEHFGAAGGECGGSPRFPWSQPPPRPRNHPEGGGGPAGGGPE